MKYQVTLVRKLSINLKGEPVGASTEVWEAIVEKEAQYDIGQPYSSLKEALFRYNDLIRSENTPLPTSFINEGFRRDGFYRVVIRPVPDESDNLIVLEF